MTNILLVGVGGFVGSIIRQDRTSFRSLTVVVEIADTKKRLEAFLDLIAPHIKAGMVMLKKAQIRFYCADKN
jgi:PII-like signaling protein